MPDNQPVQVSFAPMAATAVGSSALGDQVGNALADVLVWVVQVSLNSVPPASVVSAFHSLCVFSVVALSLTVHYFILKTKN